MGPQIISPSVKLPQLNTSIQKSKNAVTSGAPKWTSNFDNILKKYLDQYGPNIQLVQAFFPGFSKDFLEKKIQKLEKNKKFKTKKNDNELTKLIVLVNEIGENWDVIQDHFPNTSIDKLKSMYYNKASTSAGHQDNKSKFAHQQLSETYPVKQEERDSLGQSEDKISDEFERGATRKLSRANNNFFGFETIQDNNCGLLMGCFDNDDKRDTLSCNSYQEELLCYDEDAYNFTYDLKDSCIINTRFDHNNNINGDGMDVENYCGVDSNTNIPTGKKIAKINNDIND